MTINEVLRSQINEAQNRIARFVRPLRLMDRLPGSIDEAVSAFAEKLVRPRRLLVRLCVLMLRFFERGFSADNVPQLAVD